MSIIECSAEDIDREGVVQSYHDLSSVILSGRSNAGDSFNRLMSSQGVVVLNDDYSSLGHFQLVVNENVESELSEEMAVTTDIQGLADGTISLVSSIEDFRAGQTVLLSDGRTAILQESSGGFQLVLCEDRNVVIVSPDTSAGNNLDSESSILNLDGQSIIGCLEQTSKSNASGDNADFEELESAIRNPLDITSRSSVAMDIKGYPCPYENCGRAYTTTHHLKVHIRSHTGDRPFPCVFDGCGKAFPTSYGLKSHARIHSGEKPYECPYVVCDPPCFKAFKTSGDLQKHLRTHTGSKPFECPYKDCGQTFTTACIRKVHMRTHTGERPFVCEEIGCGKSFSSATNFKNHIRIHSGEKPYVCLVDGCNKRFTEYSSLYKHHVVHTHDKPYHCLRCGKTYRQTSTLTMHQRMAHGEDGCGDIKDEADGRDGLSDMMGDGGGERESVISIILPSSGDTSQSCVSFRLKDNPSCPLEDVAGNLAIDTEGHNSSGPLSLANVSSEAIINSLRLGIGDDGGGVRGNVYVITDPAQIEALTRLTNQQAGSVQNNRISSTSSMLSAANTNCYRL